MEEKKFKFQSTVDRFPPIPVKKSRKSLTVPDMSFTPREIIAKFSRGEKVPLGFGSLYDSEDDSDQPGFSGYDPMIFEEDPTRDPSFDFGDYVEEKHALKERQAKAKRAQQRKKLSNSKREASAKEVSASDPTPRETTSGEVDNSPTVQSQS